MFRIFLTFKRHFLCKHTLVMLSICLVFHFCDENTIIALVTSFYYNIRSCFSGKIRKYGSP